VVTDTTAAGGVSRHFRNLTLTRLGTCPDLRETTLNPLRASGTF